MFLVKVQSRWSGEVGVGTANVLVIDYERCGARGWVSRWEDVTSDYSNGSKPEKFFIHGG